MYRVGRKVGRTIYRQSEYDPSDDDELVGMMDSRELAKLAVDAMNAAGAGAGGVITIMCAEHHIVGCERCSAPTLTVSTDAAVLGARLMEYVHLLETEHKGQSVHADCIARDLRRMLTTWARLP